MADPDVWMLDAGDHYEYICMYVDDILVMKKNPMEFINKLKEHYILKGVGVPEYYLGADIKWYKKSRGSLDYGMSNICQEVCGYCGKDDW